MQVVEYIRQVQVFAYAYLHALAILQALFPGFKPAVWLAEGQQVMPALYSVLVATLQLSLGVPGYAARSFLHVQLPHLPLHVHAGSDDPGVGPCPSWAVAGGAAVERAHAAPPRGLWPGFHPSRCSCCG